MNGEVIGFRWFGNTVHIFQNAKKMFESNVAKLTYTNIGKNKL